LDSPQSLRTNLFNPHATIKSDELSSELIEIVKMRGEGNSYVEIGEHFGASADSIRMKLNRAKKTLSATLDVALGSSK
jgi:DNA-directed RNA polymerase specialized sigma24 family protein